MDGWEAPVNGREQRGGDVCTWSDDRSDQELQPSVRFILNEMQLQVRRSEQGSTVRRFINPEDYQTTSSLGLTGRSGLRSVQYLHHSSDQNIHTFWLLKTQPCC